MKEVFLNCLSLTVLFLLRFFLYVAFAVERVGKLFALFWGKLRVCMFNLIIF